MKKRLGIVFAGGEGPPPGDVARICATRPEALRVAADSGLLLARAAGIEPGWIVGDMDSLAESELAREGGAERALRHPADKDLSDTELALALLVEKGCEDAWIIGGGGGRLAHLLAIFGLFQRPGFPSRWITAGADARRLEAGEETRESVAPGSLVSVFPLASGPWRAESQGLKWPLRDARWEGGPSVGLSNVALDGGIALRSVEGRFIVILEGTCQR
ncbi:MAG: thiamine diphosphokinase [Treponema sp.]|nr:thiamine diphosphokinase [Treponema sp.]